MVKFNRSHLKQEFEDENSASMISIDWQQLLVDFQNKPVDETIKNIMEKLIVKENVEFDQICLILKHYLLIENENQEQTYLNHFLTFNDQIYTNQLIERFNNLNQSQNSQWMITEIIKLITSICSKEQADYLLKSAQFSNFLLNTVFNSSILEKLKLKNNSGLSQTEAAILTNIFETISNLCEVKQELKNYVSQSHIEWLANALNGINKSQKDLTISIAHLFHLLSDNQNLNEYLADLFINKNFFQSSINYLSSMDNVENVNNIDQLSFNLNSKLYLISCLINLISLNQKFDFKKSDYLLRILKDYGLLIQYSLSLSLSENKPNRNKSSNEEENENDENEETKTVIKSLEYSIEAKMLSLDLLSNIVNFFINNTEEEAEAEEEEEYEEWEDDELTDDNNNRPEMDVEMENKKENASCQNEIIELKNVISELQISSLLVQTISKDDENIFQEADRIDHIYNSVKLIRNESLKTYLLLIETFYLQNKTLNEPNQIDIENLFILLDLLNKKTAQDLEIFDSKKKNESIIKFVEIIYDLFIYFQDLNLLTKEHKLSIINNIKDILLKFKTDVIDLCIRLARIIGLIAIKERNTNLFEAQDLIQFSASIILELSIASFEFGDQSKIETLRLNAELLDLIIDIFGDENLAELEKSLNFIEKIKFFSDKFYTKYKQLTKKQKIHKDSSLIIKTVKDNFKSFVDYKIKNSK